MIGMGTVRRIRKVLKSKATVEGAGVNLKRAFGFYHVPQLDPSEKKRQDPDRWG